MRSAEITVVIATRDRPARLRALLESLAEQDLDRHSFEVIVVDDGSAAPLAASVARPGAGLRLEVLRHASPRGPAAARNTGWRRASADTVAFTDDDCRADPGWLRAILRTVAARPGAVVQGRTLPDPDDRAPGPFSRTQAVVGPDQLYETCNIAYPRAVLEAVTGFDERYRRPCGEDVDLGWRARKAGTPLVFEEGALIYHSVTEPSLAAALRHTMMWTDAVRLLSDHPELRSLLHRRVYWKPTHPPLLVVIAGLCASLATRRAAPAALASLPYLRHYWRHYGLAGRSRRALLRAMPRHLAIDLCEVGTMVAGSVRHRTLML